MSKSDMNEAIEIILACSTAMLPQTRLNGKKGRCSGCDTDVWLAPSSTKLLDANSKIRVLCEKCIEPELEKKTGPVEVCIAPGATEEIRQLMRGVRNN